MGKVTLMFALLLLILIKTPNFAFSVNTDSSDSSSLKVTRSSGKNGTQYVLSYIKSFGDKTLNKIRWLHFPRTGNYFPFRFQTMSPHKQNFHCFIQGWELLQQFCDMLVRI